MNGRILIAATVCVAALAVHGHTEEIPAAKHPARPEVTTRGEASPTSEGTAATLERLTGQAAILEVQARIARARRDIAESEKGILASQTAVPDPNSPTAAPSGQILPSVSVISGSGHNLSAEVVLPSGGMAVVRTGSTIGGLGRVVSISEGGVVVDANGQRVTLPFGVEAERPSRETAARRAPFNPVRPVASLPTPRPPAAVPLPPMPLGMRADRQ